MDKCLLMMSMLSSILFSGTISFGMDQQSDWKENIALIERFNRPTVLLLCDTPTCAPFLPKDLRLMVYGNFDNRDLYRYSLTSKTNHSELYSYLYNKAGIPTLDSQISQYIARNYQYMQKNNEHMSLKMTDLIVNTERARAEELKKFPIIRNAWLIEDKKG